MPFQSRTALKTASRIGLEALWIPASTRISLRSCLSTRKRRSRASAFDPETLHLLDSCVVDQDLRLAQEKEKPLLVDLLQRLANLLQQGGTRVRRFWLLHEIKYISLAVRRLSQGPSQQAISGNRCHEGLSVLAAEKLHDVAAIHGDRGKSRK